MWNGINRRKFPRASYRCIVTIKNIGELPKIITTRTENIGLGGVCVILREPIELFKKVELEILIEDSGSPIRCNGSVVWLVKKLDPVRKNAVSFDIGIEYIDIRQSDKTRIGNVVEKLLASS